MTAAAPALQPEEEQWVLVRWEMDLPDQQLKIADPHLEEGVHYETMDYSYNEYGEEIKFVQSYNWIPSVTTVYKNMQYDEHGSVIYYQQTVEEFSSYDGQTKTSVNDPFTREFEYDGAGNITKQSERSSSGRTVKEYERDSDGHVTKETTTSYNEAGENTGSIVKELEYVGGLRRKKTETTCGEAGDVTLRYVSQYDEQGQEVLKERTLPEGKGQRIETTYSRDEENDLSIATSVKYEEATGSSVTTVEEKRHDGEGRLIYYKIATYLEDGSITMSSWYTREYDADGHSYTQTDYAVNGDDALGVKVGDVLNVIYYKYLPLSEALAQQQEDPSVKVIETLDTSAGADAGWVGVYRYDDGNQGLLLIVRDADAATVSGDLVYANEAEGYDNRTFEWTITDSDPNAATEPFQVDREVTYRRSGSSIIADYPEGWWADREYTYLCGLEETEKYMGHSGLKGLN